MVTTILVRNQDLPQVLQPKQPKYQTRSETQARSETQTIINIIKIIKTVKYHQNCQKQSKSSKLSNIIKTVKNHQNVTNISSKNTKNTLKYDINRPPPGPQDLTDRDSRRLEPRDQPGPQTCLKYIKKHEKYTKIHTFYHFIQHYY